MGAQIHKLDKSLKVISASGDTLSMIGTADVFFTPQVTGMKKKLLQCTVLRGNYQNPEILVSLEKMKRLGIVHQTFSFIPSTIFYLINKLLEVNILKNTTVTIISFINLQSQKYKSLQERKMSFVTN